MTKHKRQSSPSKESSTSWFASLSPTVQDLLCVGLLYAIALFVFRGGVFENKKFSSAVDDLNHRIVNNQIGKSVEKDEGVAPTLWFPHIFSGMPSFGSLSYQPEVPPFNIHSVSYLEFVVVRVLELLFFLNIDSWLVAYYFMGGVFMFFLLRRWKFSRMASLLGSLTFMLSPYAIALAGAGHGSKLKALSYLPLVFLLTHELFERRNLLSFGLLSAAIGTLLLTNHVQIVYYGFLVIGLYALYTVVIDMRTQPGRIPGNVTLFTGALAVGLCISSYIYLSVYEYSQYSIRGGGTEGKAGGLAWTYATNWSLNPVELVTLLMPSFFGLQSPYYWGSMPSTSSTIYVGIIPILLGIMALVYRRNRMTWFFFGLTCLVLVMSFGKHFGLLYGILFDYLPFFNKFRAPSTIMHILPFTFAFLGAYGYSALESGDLAKGEKPGKVLLIVLFAIGGLLMVAVLAKTQIYETLSGFMFVKEGEFQQYQQRYGQQATQVLDQLRQIRFFGNSQITGLWNDYVRFSILSMLSLGLVVALLRKYLTLTLFGVGVFAILSFDLFSIDARFINPVTSKSEDRVKADATTQYLKEQAGSFRVFALGGDQLTDLSLQYNGLHTIGGYHPAKLKIYQTLLDSCLNKGNDPAFPLNMNVINMLNVRYIVTEFSLPKDRFTLAHSDPPSGKAIYENPAALPRAFFVKNVRLAASEHEVFTALNSPSFDPATTAVVEKPVSIPSALAQGDSSPAAVDVVELKSRSIRIKATTPLPALLVLSEIYYPAGWKAAIDGQETEIFKTNSVLRSVVVPAGTHEMSFTFDPWSYRAGLNLSRAGWILALFCIGGGLSRTPSIRRRIGIAKDKKVEPEEQPVRKP